MAVNEYYGPGGQSNSNYGGSDQYTLGSAKLSGAYFLFCQDDIAHAPVGEYYLARLMFLEAGQYTFKAFGDDIIRIEINGQQVLYQESAYRTYEDPAEGTITLTERGAVRVDVYYTQVPDNTPSWAIFAIYDEDGTAVYVSRAEYWVCGGLPIDDDDLDPEGGEDPKSDTRLQLPLWLNEPNWENGMIETLEWKTWIGTSESSAEQRVAQRRFPRRSIEANFRGLDFKHSLLQQALVAAGRYQMLVPLWMYRTRLTQELTAQSTSVFGDFRFRQFVAGEIILLRNPEDFYDYELATLNEASDGELITTTPLQKAWPKHTYILPVRVFRIVDEASLTARSSRAVDATVRFEQDTIERQTVDISAFPLHPLDGLPVLGIDNNWRETPSLGYRRDVFAFDNEIGRPAYFDVGGQSQFAVNWMYSTYGRAELNFLRSLLYYFRGRLRICWVPSLTDDITVVETVRPLEGEVGVQRFGYAQYGAVDQDIRKNIVFVMKDGTIIFNQVVSSRTRGDVEYLTLADNLTQAYEPEDFLRVIFISRARLNSDSLEIKHHTDADGAQETALPFLQIDNLRQV